jgi:hypothetical protein
MLAFNLTNEASLRTALSDPFASTCQLFAFERSMELGDLPTAAHSLQFWVLSDPELAVPDTLVRLARVCQRIGRVHVAAQIGAHLALAAAKAHVEKIYAHLVRELVGDNPDVHGPATARRIKLAEVLAKANELKHKALPVSLLAALTKLGSEQDATDVERGEIAMELWRLSPTESARSAALQHVGQAFDAEPSTAVRRWLDELEAEVPAIGVTLPPPVGIGEKIATPAQALEALAELESAVAAHT